MTILFPAPIFGPVHSRRLGTSLGINLLPADGKVCSFDCVYCECGLKKDFVPHQKFPTRTEVREALHAQLLKMKDENMAPDVITFAGNGEPTIHPEFAGIIDDTIALRNEFFPDAKVSVLSNAAHISDESVFQALMKVDNNILKLDTVSLEYIKFIDRPVSKSYDVKKIIEDMKKFNGRCIIQTMFITGTYDGISVDNTGDEYVNPWLEAVKEIQPSEVMIYTIERETPVNTLFKASKESLDSIARKVEECGFPCQVSY